MQQLTGLDDLFLRMETDASFGHVASVSILDPRRAPVPITLERVKEVFDARLHLLPMLRRRVVEVPFGLDHPYWVDDPDFDLDHHVAMVELPKPGNQRQLQRVAARIVARPLDRSRPLWHTTLITGIEGGRVGLLTRIHHAMIDGMAGNDVLTTLMDGTRKLPDLGPPPHWQPESPPDSLALLGLTSVSLGARPLRFLQLELEAADAIAAALGRARDSGSMLCRTLTIPPTPFNHTVSATRVWEFRRLPLNRFTRVKRVFGCSVNDVVLAVCAGALRRWLLEHDALPALPLVAGVPVSIRSSGDYRFGNRLAAITAELPTHLSDPVERLHAVHDSATSAKRVQGAVPVSLLEDAVEFVAPTAAEAAVRAAHAVHLFDAAAQPFNVIVSNVPGPAHTLYFGGARLLGIYPLSALADGQGLNISLLGYRDGLHFGLLACPELVPDLTDLADYLGAELDLLATAASQREAQQPGASPARKRTSAKTALHRQAGTATPRRSRRLPSR